MSYHHDIIFFNPKWCFNPPVPGKSQAHKISGAGTTRATTGKSSSCGQKKECLVVPTSPAICCMGQIKPERPSSGKAAFTSERAYSSSRGRRTSKVLSITRALFRRRRSSSSSRSPRASSRVGVDVAGAVVVDMDPPLPVVRPVARAVNPVILWERRRGGVGLKGLELQGLQSMQVTLKN